jgi:hypothetical protein
VPSSTVAHATVNVCVSLRRRLEIDTLATISFDVSSAKDIVLTVATQTTSTTTMVNRRDTCFTFVRNDLQLV